MARDSREPEELLRTGAEGLGSRAAAASGASPGARSMWCGSRPSLCRRVMQSRMSRQPARRLDPYLGRPQLVLVPALGTSTQGMHVYMHYLLLHHFSVEFNPKDCWLTRAFTAPSSL